MPPFATGATGIGFTPSSGTPPFATGAIGAGLIPSSAIPPFATGPRGPAGGAPFSSLATAPSPLGVSREQAALESETAIAARTGTTEQNERFIPVNVRPAGPGRNPLAANGASSARTTRPSLHGDALQNWGTTFDLALP